MLEHRQDVDECRARQRAFDLSRASVVQVLDRGVGRRWDVEAEGLHREVAVRVSPDLRPEVLGGRAGFGIMTYFV